MKRGIRPKGEWLFCLLFMLFLALPFKVMLAFTLDKAGDLQKPGEEEVNRILSAQSGEEIKDPEILFYLGKMEEDGDSSRRLFQEITMHFPDWKNADAALLLISKYQFSRGMYLTVVDLTGEFDQKHLTSAKPPELLWISGCSFLATDQPDSALVQFERIRISYPGSIWAAWAQLGKGDCLFTLGDYDQAEDEYQKVLDDYKDSEAFAFAISGLIRCYQKLDDSEKALLYHNLLKERYPASLELVENPTEVIGHQDRIEDEDRAERLAGVRYTIQLGLFAKAEEARQLRSRLKKQGYSVNISDKRISGKKYHMVTLGSFVSYQKAKKLKKELESKTQESYRIIFE